MKHVMCMLERGRASVLLLGIGMIFVGLMFVAGCSLEGPTAFTKDENVDQSSLHSTSSSTQPHFLRRAYPLAKGAKHDENDEGDDGSFFYAEKLIDAAEGGKLEVGTGKAGKSKLIVPENALSEDTILSMKVPKYGDLIATISEADLGPDGTAFARPVKVELSYKGADLTGCDEENLRAWYYDVETGEWECIGGTVDVGKKKVTFRIYHFSRYGLCPR